MTRVEKYTYSIPCEKIIFRNFFLVLIQLNHISCCNGMIEQRGKNRKVIDEILPYNQAIVIKTRFSN